MSPRLALVLIGALALPLGCGESETTLPAAEAPPEEPVEEAAPFPANVDFRITFNSTGAAAAAENRPNELRMPENSAASEMNTI